MAVAATSGNTESPPGQMPAAGDARSVAPDATPPNSQPPDNEVPPGTSPANDVQSPEEAEQTALTIVANRYDVPLQELLILDWVESTFPLTGATSRSYKISDERDGTIYEIILSLGGEELEYSQLLADERAVREARYGRLSPALFERLAEADPDELIRVIIRVDMPPDPGVERPESGTEMTDEEVDLFLRENDVRLAARAKLAVGSVVQRLAARGHDMRTMSYQPVIYGELDPETIKDVAGWGEVIEISEDIIIPSFMSSAPATVRATTVHRNGITGMFAEVAQVESMGGRISAANF